MAAHQYRNPPILEAVCEVSFAPATDEWNISYPWLFYEKVKNIYTGAPKEQKLVRLDSSPPGLLEKEVSPFTVVEQSKIQFPLADDTALIAVGPNVLSAHVKRPYPGWDIFKGRIAEALKEYIGVASPTGIRKIGLRYINQVTIPDPQPNVANYFTIPPPNVLPEELVTDNFLSRNEYIYQDEPIRVVLNFARTEAPPTVSAYLLDIDLVWQWPAEPLPIASVMNKVDELRRRERVIFERLITDQSRELFDAA
ncbi:MAG: TIGR04255 family protein [Gallionella sp.]|nr:TIGR04255 family protein [Gallionella sp.]